MKNFILLFAAFLFTGCFGLFESSPEVAQASDGNAKGYKEVMRIKADCSSCASGGQDIKINGTDYTSDVAIKCCLRDNLIDTGVALKKVFIHRIIDSRQSTDAIKFTKKNGRSYIFTSNPRLEALFYLFLKQELNSRGIMVVETQTSPYTYRLDFSFTDLKGSYSQSTRYLEARLEGAVRFSNINFTRNFSFTTTQEAVKLKAEKSKDFDLYVSLLVKQMANKVAEEISKI